MKRKWHIKTHLSLMLIALTGALLLTVALVFNLSMFGFVRSRVSEQLSNVSQSASDERMRIRPDQSPGRDQPSNQEQTSSQEQSSKQEQSSTQDQSREDGQPSDPGPAPDESIDFDDHQDRVMGTRGSAVVLNSDGSVRFTMHGDETVAEALAAWRSDHFEGDSIRNKLIFLDEGTFVVSAEEDPVAQGQTLLTYVDVTSVMSFTGLIDVVLLAVILVAVLLSVLLSRRFARSFSSPVRSLSDFARDIGSGDLEPRSLDFRDVEFDSLADSMNRMASDLKEARLKQEIFFQNVSHELRTPLTSIRGNAEGIVCGLMEPKQASKVILSESEKLGGLVEDILFLSRAGKEKKAEAEEILDLREVMSLCVSEQRTEAEKNGISFEFVFDDEPVLMKIREQDAERMIGNLLSNAIRYAKKVVTLRCRNESGCVYLSVEDDGDGISAEDLPHVFERMYKGKGGKHGIGLAIAKAVAESGGGRISAKSENGAAFEVIFPRS